MKLKPLTFLKLQHQNEPVEQKPAEDEEIEKEKKKEEKKKKMAELSKPKNKKTEEDENSWWTPPPSGLHDNWLPKQNPNLTNFINSM